MVWMVFPRPISSARITLLLLQEEEEKKILSSQRNKEQGCQYPMSPSKTLQCESQLYFLSPAIKSPT